MSDAGAINTAGGQPGAAKGQAQIPAPPKLVKVFVDGVEVETDSRDNLIEAARRIGVAIPYFCYHPRLSIAGQCRMCLVETSDAPGRLVPGCQVRGPGLPILSALPRLIKGHAVADLIPIFDSINMIGGEVEQ